MRNNNLRELRLARGWTQEDLANETEIPAKRISKFETGRLGSTEDERRRLCEALKVESSRLLLPAARPVGGQKRPTSELLARFRVVPPPLPPPECTSAARLASLWRKCPAFMRRVSPKLEPWKEFLGTAPSEASGETIYQLHQLDHGAQTTAVTLDWLGYDRWPSVDPKTGLANGHCLRPALITEDWIMVFQVTVQTPKQKYRMDALVLVLEPQRTLVNVELDGRFHDPSGDAEREEILNILTIRIRDDEILTGPSLTERLRELGLCQKRAA